jgi:predicted nucleotidyltransferase
MKSKEEILKILDGIKKEAKRKYKVEKIGLFGSFAMESQKPGSDIDVLVRFKENADLFDLIGLAMFLEEKLGQKVDVVPEAALRYELRESVLKQVAYV